MEHLPCINCKTPIPADIHAEELGMCVSCSNDYYNHICDKCGKEDVNNWDNNPFTRFCESCEVAK